MQVRTGGAFSEWLRVSREQRGPLLSLPSAERRERTAQRADSSTLGSNVACLCGSETQTEVSARPRQRCFGTHAPFDSQGPVLCGVTTRQGYTVVIQVLDSQHTT